MWSVAAKNALNLSRLRSRLNQMTTDELLMYSEAACVMCTTHVNSDGRPDEQCGTQLQEIRAELKLRGRLTTNS
jgi:hypothetical protein